MLSAAKHDNRARVVYVGTGLAPSSFLCRCPRSCTAALLLYPVLAPVPPPSLLYPIHMPLPWHLCRRPRLVGTQILRGVYPERSEGMTGDQEYQLTRSIRKTTREPPSSRSSPRGRKSGAKNDSRAQQMTTPKLAFSNKDSYSGEKRLAQ